MPVARGLAGIEVDNTAISEVDGVAGQLRYRGYPVEELVDLSFPSVAYLVLHGELPTTTQARQFAELLRESSRISTALSTMLLALGAHAKHPMLALQSALPLLGAALTTELDNATNEDPMHRGVRIAALLPTVLSIIGAGAREENTPPHVPDVEDYGARVLTQITGRRPSADAARAFEQIQILQLDHGFNAGTFTARVVASTLAPVESCISAALGALYGKLHGGADQAAIEMARHIGSAELARSEITAMNERGEKVMGMGHREYRVIDPRSLITEGIAERIATPGAGVEELAVLRAVAIACAGALGGRSKPIHPNLEFYKGVVYLAVGLQPTQFTAAFALARVFGYVAHIVKSRVDNRIVRPAAHYVGEPLRHV